MTEMRIPDLRKGSAVLRSRVMCNHKLRKSIHSYKLKQMDLCLFLKHNLIKWKVCGVVNFYSRISKTSEVIKRKERSIQSHQVMSDNQNEERKSRDCLQGCWWPVCWGACEVQECKLLYFQKPRWWQTLWNLGEKIQIEKCQA